MLKPISPQELCSRRLKTYTKILKKIKKYFTTGISLFFFCKVPLLFNVKIRISLIFFQNLTNFFILILKI